VSGIDDSVQYYSLVPALPREKGSSPMSGRGLVFTLHGAAVEASGQAACFDAQVMGARRGADEPPPLRFDWEDWGRLDAMEVLDLARGSLRPIRARPT